MQFSEVSEVQWIIGSLRVQENNKSNLFHDRNDSEVDRLFRSSPPISDSISLDQPPPLPQSSFENAKQEKTNTILRREGENKIVTNPSKNMNSKGIKTILFTPSSYQEDTSTPLFPKESIPMHLTILKSTLSTNGIKGDLSNMNLPTGSDLNMLHLIIYLPNQKEMNIPVRFYINTNYLKYIYIICSCMKYQPLKNP